MDRRQHSWKCNWKTFKERTSSLAHWKTCDILALMKEYVKEKFPNSEYLVNMYDLIANAYRDKKDYQQYQII